MLAPRRPIDGLRQDRFRPPHCPRRHCRAHRVERGRFRWRRRGLTRRTRCYPPQRRFQCLHCGSVFSRRAFSATYYLKRPELLPCIAAGLVAGSAHRQIARTLGCAPSTVTNQAARLGRHCLLLQTTLLDALGPPREPVVADHLVGFTFSQRDRIGIATPIGTRSWFDYGPEVALWRGQPRGGRRKPPLRRPLPEVDSGSVARSMRALLDRLVRPDSRLELIVDDHPAYRRAVTTHPLRSRIDVAVYRNPKRRTTPTERAAARARHGAMFAADMVHQLARHTLAHHRRETIAFGRRSNAAMERAFVYAIWRNLVKRRSERAPDERSPAVERGLTPRRFDWDEVLARRLFPDRVGPPDSWRPIYRRELITPAVGRNRVHRLRLAY